MIRERNQTFKIGFILLDWVLSFLAFTSAVYFRFYVIGADKKVLPDTGGIFAPGQMLGLNEHTIIWGTYLYIALLYSISQVLVFLAADLYHPRRGVRYFREMLAIGRGVAGNLLVILALLFFYRGTSYSRMVILYAFVFSIVFHSTGHYLLRRIMIALRARGIYARGVIVLGAGKSAERIIQTLRLHKIYGYQILGVLGSKRDAVASLKGELTGNIKDLKREVEQKKPDLVIYATRHDFDLLTQVIDYCDQEGLDCRIVPEMVDFITHSARIEEMDGIPIMTIRDTPLKNGYHRFLKRSFDIVFSLVVLTLLLPVFLLVAILIKLDSTGPVFFLQERTGIDRKSFKLIKFRSMVTQAASVSDTTWGSSNDSRVTRLGAFLRKSSIDELPQFINVLIGNMSVVGPRPERPHFVQQFKSKVTHYMRRHSVKSGITGWAQIQGWRGDTSIEKRVEQDIYYIENWSFWLDLVIIFRTIPALVKNPGE